MTRGDNAKVVVVSGGKPDLTDVDVMAVDPRNPEHVQAAQEVRARLDDHLAGSGFANGGFVRNGFDRGDTIAAQLSPARSIARLSIAPEDVRSFTITMENTLPFRERPAIGTGTIEVHGELVVTFQDDGGLLRIMRHGQRAVMNRALRMVRPQLGRRKFRRIRAQVRQAMRGKRL